MKILYDAPIAHSSVILPDYFPETKAFSYMKDAEKRMFEKINQIKPTKVFIEAISKGLTLDNYSIEGKNTWKYLKDLHEDGITIEGMENKQLYNLQGRIKNNRNEYFSKHIGIFNGSDKLTLSLAIKFHVANSLYSILDEIINRSRSYEMARCVINSLDDNDVVVMVHGEGHNLRQIIRFLSRDIKIEPVDEDIEREFKRCFEMEEKEIEKFVKEELIPKRNSKSI